MYRAKLRYTTVLSFDPTGTLAQTWVFQASQGMDPNADGTSRPRGWATLAAIYEQYCVLGAKLTINSFISTINNLNPAGFGILKYQLNAGAPSLTNFDQLDFKAIKNRSRLASTGFVGARNAGYSTRTSLGYSLRKDLHATTRDQESWFDTDTWDAAADDRSFGLVVMAFPLNPGTNPGAFHVMANLEYTMLFKSRRILNVN